MKRHLITLFLLMTGLTAMAQDTQGLSENQCLLGYTLSDDIDQSGVFFDAAGTYIVGAAIPPEVLAAYKGCKVVGVRMAAAQDLGRTRTFLYNFNGLTFEELYSQKQRLFEGWNAVFFNGDGYEIKGNEMLFFGFDYVETDEMVAAEKGGLCCSGTYTDGGFYIYGDYGQGTGLYPISGAGNLCVQLVVDVSTLPHHKATMTYLDTGFKYKMPGTDFDLMVNYRNTGRDSLFCVQLGYQIDEQEPVLTMVNDTLASGHSDSWIVKVELPAELPIGTHTLKAFVSQVGGKPQVDDQWTMTAVESAITNTFAVYQQSVERSQVYMEVYTDQSSPYSSMLNKAIATLTQDNERLCVVNVHRPGTSLAIDEAAYLHDLYAYTWPTFTINRSYFPGEAYVSYDMNDYLPVIPADMTASIISDMLLQDLYSASFATVGMEGTYDEATRQLTINVSGEALPEAEAIYGQMALTLLVAEDEVKGSQLVYNNVTGRTTTNSNYAHNQVLRAFVTPAVGTPLDVTDGRYSETFTITLDAAWVPEHLRVVALLTKAVDEVTDDNVKDVDVINCNSLPLAPVIAQSIEDIPHSSFLTPHSSLYTLNGKRVDASSAKPGIYIVRGSNGKSRKVVVR